MADHIGQQFGNYHLLRLLGEGGFAEVYLGEHIYLGTRAAIKVLHTQLTSDDVERFRTEARTIARLIHPHIVRVLEFGVEGKTPFLVMDYAPNGTLRQRHPKGVALPLPLIVAYVRQVADALQYAHDEKLIHRDIKPENMLLGRRSELLLSDFGIALVAQSSRYQSTQEMAGTMAYMAPEQIQGKPRPASDQYSLGVIVYEWLSGDRPFHGSLTELVGQHLSVPPVSLREKIPTISSEVDQVVLTALAKDPKERFESVQAFAATLGQIWQSEQALDAAATFQAKPASTIEPKLEIASSSSSFTYLASPERNAESPVVSMNGGFLPTITTSISEANSALSISKSSNTSESTFLPLTDVEMPSIPSPAQVVIPFKHRISRRRVLAGLAGLAVVGGGLTWLIASQNHQSEKGVPVLEKPPGTTLEIYRGHSEEVWSVAWSPDGKYIASGSQDWTVQIWNASTGKQIIKHKDVYLVTDVAWSPNGKYIASTTAGAGSTAVQVWDVAHGALVFNQPYLGGQQYCVAWSPNGKYIALGSLPDVLVWDFTTGDRIIVYKGHENPDTPVWSVAWSPDGKYIASAGPSGSTQQQGTVQVWDPHTGSRMADYKADTMVLSAVWSPDGKMIVLGLWDGTVRVWEPLTNGLLGPHPKFTTLVLAKLGKLLFSVEASHQGDCSLPAPYVRDVVKFSTGSMSLQYFVCTCNTEIVALLENWRYVCGGSSCSVLYYRYSF